MCGVIVCDFLLVGLDGFWCHFSTEQYRCLSDGNIQEICKVRSLIWFINELSGNW